jgi:hypothetical protein
VIVQAKDLRPGDLMFGPIGGAVGESIGACQTVIAPWKSLLTWKTWWRLRHAAIVTGQSDGYVTIGQAMPSGFEVVPLRPDQWNPDYVFIRPRYAEGQAQAVAETAGEMARRGIGYSFADYAAIAAHRLHVPAPHLDRFIGQADADGYPLRSICSQAVDFALTRSGGLDGHGHVFDDGRLSQDVVPAELYVRLLQLDPVNVIRPGKAAISRRVPSAISDIDQDPRAWRIINQGLL